MHIEHLKLSLYNWAQSRQTILAIGIVGSYARGTQTQESDVDLVVVSTDPSQLLRDIDWMDRFGVIKSNVPEDYGLVQSLRCFSNDGREIEFGITSKQWCTPPIDTGTADVIRHGLMIVYDPSSDLKYALDWVASNAVR